MKAKEHWIQAQGYDPVWHDWNEERELFGRNTCIVCGSKWRPGEPRFIAVYGDARVANEEWYCESTIGIYPHRYLQDPVYKYVCLYHGDKWPVLFDCVVAEDVNLFSLAGQFGIPVSGAHNSLGDAYITAQLFQRFLSILQGRGDKTVNTLLKAAKP